MHVQNERTGLNRVSHVVSLTHDKLTEHL